MVAKSVQMYLNLQRGLLYETSSSQPKKLDHVVGKKVEYEVLELNCVKIDGKFYMIIGYLNDLAHLKLIDEEDVGVSCDLKFVWDEIHKKIWDVLSDEVSPNIINDMVDMCVAREYGVTVEYLNRKVK